MSTPQTASPVSTTAPAASAASSAPTSGGAEAQPASTSAQPQPAQKPTHDPAAVKALLQAKGRLPPGPPAARVESTTGSPSNTAPADSRKPSAETAATETPPSIDEGDPKLAKRLAEIAKRERLQREGEAEVKALREKASKWDAFDGARTKEGRLAALKTLFNADEITRDLYNELTDEVIRSHKPVEETEEDKTRRLFREEAEKREKEASDKVKAEREAKVTEAVTAYNGAVAKTFEASPDRWPLIAELGVQLDDRVHGENGIMRTHYKQHGVPLKPEELLDRLETEHRERIEKAHALLNRAKPEAAKPAEAQGGSHLAKFRPERVSTPEGTAPEKKLSRDEWKAQLLAKHGIK